MSNIYPSLAPSPPLRDQVHFALEELILEGHLPAGFRLIESDLAERLGVSRGPIREALQLLERDGWLEMRPRRGTYVREPEEKELDDYFSARCLLESEGARLAARRVAREPEATSALVDQIEHLHERSGRLSERLPDEETTVNTSMAGLEQRRSYRENSRQLHRSIVLLSGNIALIETLEYVNRRTRWWFASSAKSRRTSRRGEHAAVIEAISAGDEERAAESMERHLEELRVASLEAFRRQREEGDGAEQPAG